ncbi:MAG: TetR/AcrR family transcriptional regulator [Proteobacteria bacterium]|nr:TetR/AcrR family transcriptional regulator [Pseudomonadota bacterium]
MKKLNTTHSNTDNRKKAIIHGALECFISTGISETSISDICKKSNSSTGSLYHHFGSKEKLAAKVYLEGIQDYQKGFVHALEASTDAKSGIFGVIAYHLKWVVDHPAWAIFLFRERHSGFMGQSEHELHQLNGEFVNKISVWFFGHVASGTLRKLKPDVYQPILLGPVQEYVRHYVSCAHKPDIKNVAEELALAAWLSLGSEQKE